MNLDENYKALDKPGRDKFKRMCEYYGWEYGEPQNDKLAFDCWFKAEGYLWLVEIKDRGPEAEKYDDLILEVDRYERIAKWNNKLYEQGVPIGGSLYVNWIGDTAYIFELWEDYVTKNRTSFLMNEVTARSREEKVMKDVFLLPKSKAIVRKLQ